MAEARRLASRLSPRRPSGALLWTAALVVFAGVIVPLIHANRFRGRIQAALENSLGRKVEIGEVTLQLLTGPGFQLHNVIIGDDPAFGAEHFAYMDEMQVRLRLRTLWTGQVQFASLTLINPSINLVKNPQGRWNFETLLARARQAGPLTAPSRRPSVPTAAARRSVPPPYFPYIGVQDGRVNFKFGDYKNAFHFQDLEAALSPARDSEGRWQIRFAGRPARTDHLLSGMGRLTGEGELATARGRLRLDLALDSSPLEYLLTLVYGRDFGLHGEIGARARVAGDVAALQIEGTLEADDLHRWDLLPAPDSRFTVPFLGRLDLPEQTLELSTGAAHLPRAPSGPAGPPPVRVHLTVSHYLSAPQWSASVELERAPADSVLRTARHFGAALPAGLELRGSLSGRVDFAGSLWPQGALHLEQGRLVVPDAPPIAVGPAVCSLGGASIELSPTELRLGDARLKGEVVEVSASGRLDGFSLASFALDAQLAARGLRLEAVRKHLQALRPGWLASLAAGTWDGRLVYSKRPGQPGAWSGEGTLSKTRWQPAALESPVDVARARVRFEPGVLHLDSMSGSLGEMRFAGACRRSAPTAGTAAAPWETENSCRIRVAALDLARLDRWLNPQQKHSRWEIWRRALGRTSPETPSWLKTAHIDGSVTVGDLRLGKWMFHNVSSDLAWTGDALELSGLRAELGASGPAKTPPARAPLGKGTVSGSLRAEFSGSEPRYRLQAAVRGADLKSFSSPAALPATFERGAVDLDLNLSTSGRSAAELQGALQASGTFEGRSITLDNVAWSQTADAAGDPEDTIDIRSVAGRFEWSRSGLELRGLRMVVGKDVYQGRGSIDARSGMLIDVATRGRQSRLVGAAEEAASSVP